MLKRDDQDTPGSGCQNSICDVIYCMFFHLGNLATWCTYMQDILFIQAYNGGFGMTPGAESHGELELVFGSL